MSKHVKEIALLCSIYDVKFNNLLKGHRLGVREDLSRNVDFALADPPYDVHTDGNNDHAEYDVDILNNIENMTKVLEDVLRLRAHGPVFCSALHFSSCTRRLLLINARSSQYQEGPCRGRP